MTKLFAKAEAKEAKLSKGIDCAIACLKKLKLG